MLTLQTALVPHCSRTQGSRHFCPIHARCRGHSGSDTHSGFGAKSNHYQYCLRQGAGKLTFSDRSANLEGVSFIPRRTDASRPVIVDFTDGVDATLIVVHTRVLALLADTCESSRAVRVNSALWFALNVWVSLESRGTGAHTSVS